MILRNGLLIQWYKVRGVGNVDIIAYRNTSYFPLISQCDAMHNQYNTIAYPVSANKVFIDTAFGYSEKANATLFIIGIY